MTSDFNKRTKTCWFYFRVEGARKGIRYRFRILNFEKPDSLFKQGQRVLCYSCATEQWFRVGGHHLSYLPNNIHTLHAASFGPFTADAAAAAAAAAVDDVAGGSECPQLYTLDFTFEPSRDGDTLYFAPCFPYSVRDNAQHLSSLQVTDPAIFTQRILFLSLAGQLTQLSGQGARANVQPVPVTLPYSLRPRDHYRCATSSASLWPSLTPPQTPPPSMSRPSPS
jgi:cytosolic carboxypeptidase protein 2/3